MVPFTEPVKRMVTVLLLSAKEARGKEMPNRKNNTNGRRNRFIRTPCNILTTVRPVLFFCAAVYGLRLYHAGSF